MKKYPQHSFTHEDKKYRAVKAAEDQSCIGCVFYENLVGCLTLEKARACLPLTRKDGQSIIWVEVKKRGL